MKQGKIFNRIIEALLLLVIVFYFGYSIYNALSDPLTTVQALAYETGSGCNTTGYVVRQEQVLTSAYAITLPSKQEGAKVAVNETVAVGYRSQQAQDRQGDMVQLEAQLKQLEAAASQTDPAALSAMDDAITAQLRSLSAYLNRGDLRAAEQAGQDAKVLILQRTADQTDAASIREQTAQVKEQIAQLRSQSSGDANALTAAASGYFSGTVDGYESILTPQALSSLSVSQLQALTPAAAAETAYGRLITSKTWYYVTAVPEELLSGKVTGDTVQVTFAHNFYDAVPMTIVRMGDPEAGTRVLVLSCDDFIQDVTLLREQSADIVFSTYSGLRVPKDAVRMVDGQIGVYVLESAAAKWKPITILYDSGESYIAQLDKSSTANLWPGDEIILDARDLFDGKVIG